MASKPNLAKSKMKYAPKSPTLMTKRRSFNNLPGTQEMNPFSSESIMRRACKLLLSDVDYIPIKSKHSKDEKTGIASKPSMNDKRQLLTLYKRCLDITKTVPNQSSSKKNMKNNSSSNVHLLPSNASSYSNKPGYKSHLQQRSATNQYIPQRGKVGAIKNKHMMPPPKSAGPRFTSLKRASSLEGNIDSVKIRKGNNVAGIKSRRSSAIELSGNDKMSGSGNKNRKTTFKEAKKGQKSEKESQNVPLAALNFLAALNAKNPQTRSTIKNKNTPLNANPNTKSPDSYIKAKKKDMVKPLFPPNTLLKQKQAHVNKSSQNQTKTQEVDSDFEPQPESDDNDDDDYDDDTTTSIPTPRSSRLRQNPKEKIIEDASSNVSMPPKPKRRVSAAAKKVFEIGQDVSVKCSGVWYGAIVKDITYPTTLDEDGNDTTQDTSKRLYVVEFGDGEIYRDVTSSRLKLSSTK